ncbi:MAG: hypothetical protein RMK49_20920 [Abditibacteriales bacterium]|nr:hypothetical protein [Abditibacteriales bacterium]
MTIDSPHQEPLAWAVQEWLGWHGIPAAVARLPFITALPNPSWGSVAVRAADAMRAKQLVQQFLLHQPLPPRQPKKARRPKRQR